MPDLYLDKLPVPHRLLWYVGYPYRRAMAFWSLRRDIHAGHITRKAAWRLAHFWARR